MCGLLHTAAGAEGTLGGGGSPATSGGRWRGNVSHHATVPADRVGVTGKDARPRRVASTRRTTFFLVPACACPHSRSALLFTVIREAAARRCYARPVRVYSTGTRWRGRSVMAPALCGTGGVLSFSSRVEFSIFRVMSLRCYELS